MKLLKYFLSAILIVTTIWSCTDEEFGSLDFLSTATAPGNGTAFINVTQDNTGTVTITPNGEGATFYEVYFGDNTASPAKVNQGGSVVHVYSEGNYDVRIVATNITGLKSEAIIPIVVSFKAPENLVVVIENDKAVSKQVNVTLTADYALLFDVYFGEAGNDVPVSANVGGTASYVYSAPGNYDIRVVAKSAAIQTTEYTATFEAKEILQPINSAQKPKFRAESDYISIFSGEYTNVAGTNFNPDWGQSGQGSGYAEFNLAGDKMLQYINLSYQGIGLADGVTIDVSGMEFLHMDVWTANVDKLETSLISKSNGEKPVTKNLTAGEWTSLDIPISEFTSQGLTVKDIYQLKLVGDPWAAGTVFVDNIYFYKAASATGNSGVTPITFEKSYELSSFDGGDISVIDNPDTNGNTSTKVAKLVKGAGQVWAGSKITTKEPFDFSSSQTVKLKVWSPRAGVKLLLKFEDVTPWPNTVASAEVVATTTKANQWEELTFDFSGISTSVEFYNLVLIMDNGTVGDGSANYTIYLDNISAKSYLNFEPKQALSSFDGGDITVVANPDTAGNTSANVAKLVKGGGQVWAGSKITVPQPFSFTSGTFVKVKVWSPRAGLKLLLKFEDATPWPNTVASAEVVATTTKANQWEELTFNFSGISTSTDFVNLVLIMDNGTNGDGSSNYTIYLDDIAQF